MNKKRKRVSLQKKVKKLKKHDTYYPTIDSLKDIEIAYLKVPFGQVKVTAIPEGIRYIDMSSKTEITSSTPLQQITNKHLKLCISQIQEYFEGKRKVFDCVFENPNDSQFTLYLGDYGTEFQRKVWKQLQLVQFGETCAYSDIARDIGASKAVRAVGQANGRNIFPIILPCHRVIAKGGGLGGFTGGLNIKQWLLDHEKKLK